MGFAIEEQTESSEIATENSDFESFAELIALLTKSYGLRIFNVLLDCYVDDLDLPQALVSQLKSAKAKHDDLEAAHQRLLTPSKSTRQNHLNNYYSSIEPSPSSFKLDKTMSVSQRPTRTTHTQTENCYTQQRLDIKRVDAQPEKIQVCLKRSHKDSFNEQENRSPFEVAAMPLSKRSKMLLDNRESQEAPHSRVQFDDCLAGSKSNSMSFAELRLRQE